MSGKQRVYMSNAGWYGDVDVLIKEWMRDRPGGRGGGHMVLHVFWVAQGCGCKRRY